jgi:hypothetical protein
MTGGLLVLAAYGAQDIYLTGNPQITFFVAVYRRYTNFSILPINQYFTGNIDFGQKVYCQIDRIGDLISNTFLILNLPSLENYNYTDENDNLVEYFWVNAVGHSIIKIIEIEIGGNIIDRQYGIWMEIWSELTIPLNKRDGFNEMIGKSDSPINLNNNKELQLFIPLQFWFCKNIGLALPLISLQTQEVRINLTLRNYSELIVSSSGALIKDSPNNSEISLTKGYLQVDYIFLEENERKIFTKNNLQYLVEQLQVYATSLNSNGLRPDPVNPGKFIRIADLNQTITFNFNHPVKEIIWVLQNSDVLTTYPYGGNEWFNFSSQSYKNGQINGSDTITEAKFILEGQDLTDDLSNIYYRTVVPYQKHTNTPNNFIYCFSFSLHPEDYQPSGSCNFSRIDNQQLHLKISDELIDPIIQIFAVNYNILNIANGMAGIEYSN